MSGRLIHRRYLEFVFYSKWVDVEDAEDIRKLFYYLTEIFKL